MQLPRGKQIAPGAQNVNGIHDALLAAEGVPFSDVYQQFLGLLQRHMEGAEPGAYLLLIGHNIRSEWGVATLCSRPRPQAESGIAQAVARGQDCLLVPAFAVEPAHCFVFCRAICTRTLLPPPSPPADYDLKLLQRQAQETQLPLLRHARFLDTLRLAEHLRIPGTGNSLGDLHRLFTGAAHDGAHRALADCRANETVLRGLLGHMFPGGLPGEMGRGMQLRFVLCYACEMVTAQRMTSRPSWFLYHLACPPPSPPLGRLATMHPLLPQAAALTARCTLRPCTWMRPGRGGCSRRAPSSARGARRLASWM